VGGRLGRATEWLGSSHRGGGGRSAGALDGCAGNRTPDDILREVDPHRDPHRDPRVWALPALDLDQLIANLRLPTAFQKDNLAGHYLPGLAGREEVGKTKWGEVGKDPIFTECQQRYTR
jgi:hypothetical protein